MIERSRKLQRQLSRALEAEDAEAKLAALAERLRARDPVAFAEEIGLLTRLPNFLETVDRTYSDHAEQSRLVFHNLELSSSELNEANGKLRRLNLSISAMLDNLGQGIFSFDENGICSDTFSKACLGLIECSPAGKNIVDVLGIPAEQRETTQSLLKLIFTSASSAFYDDFFALLPQKFKHRKGRAISLAYRPIIDYTGGMHSILVVATDHTDEIKTLDLARKRENAALTVLRIARNRNFFARFFHSVQHYFTVTVATTLGQMSVETIRHDIHTMKGNASIFYLQEFMDLLHGIETALNLAKTPEDARACIQNKTPQALLLLSEMRLHGVRIFGEDFDRQGATRTLSLDLLNSFAAELKLFGDGSLATRFVALLMGEPIHRQLAPFDIGLQELAARYSQNIAPCVFAGENFPILTENYVPLFSTLTHIARNIVAHAVDTPETREKWGKPAALTVVIETHIFERENKPWFCLTITDDGQGINVVMLKNKIREIRGDAFMETLSNESALQMIFEDHLSTNEKLDDLAGRGVGLGAVKVEAERLGGTALVQSEINRFTRISIEVPLLWERLV